MCMAELVKKAWSWDPFFQLANMVESLSKEYDESLGIFLQNWALCAAHFQNTTHDE